MDVNDYVVSMMHRGVTSTFASRLAPTGFSDKKNIGDKKWPKQKYSVAPGSVAR